MEIVTVFGNLAPNTKVREERVKLREGDTEEEWN